MPLRLYHVKRTFPSAAIAPMRDGAIDRFFAENYVNVGLCSRAVNIGRPLALLCQIRSQGRVGSAGLQPCQEDGRLKVCGCACRPVEGRCWPPGSDCFHEPARRRGTTHLAAPRPRTQCDTLRQVAPPPGSRCVVQPRHTSRRSRWFVSAAGSRRLIERPSFRRDVRVQADGSAPAVSDNPFVERFRGSDKVVVIQRCEKRSSVRRWFSAETSSSR
jgi:hypothetical protein